MRTMTIVAALAVAGCRDAKPALPPRPVIAVPVASTTSRAFGPFAGAVEPRYETRLGFQTAGRVVARSVYVGDLVKAGDCLAALDPTLERLDLTRAKAAVADAAAQLENAQGIANRQDLLLGAGATPQSTVDVDTADLATARARLAEAQASVRIAEEQLGYTDLRASFDGVVSAWSAEVGQYVQNGQAVVTVARPDVREAVVDIPDALIVGVTPGMAFEVRPQAAPLFAANAKVREINPLADPATRTHRVRLTLDDPAPVFRLGTTVTVAHIETIPPVLSIPMQAVVEKSGRPSVWVVADGHARLRPVELGPEDGDRIVVRAGLAAGDMVVTVGVHSLAEDQPVGGVLSPASIAAAVHR